MRRRIIIGLGALLALVLLGDAAALICLKRSTHELERLVESHRIQAMREGLISAGVSVQSDLLAHLAGRRRSNEQHANHERRLNRVVRRCSHGCHHEPAIKAQLDGISETLGEYESVTHQLWSAPDGRHFPQLQGRALELSDDLVRQAAAASDQATKHLEVKSANAAQNVETARLSLFTTFGAALIVGGIVAFHLARRVTKPLEALLAGIERVRQEDPTHRVSVQGDDEFRVLASAFNQAYDDLRSAHASVLHAEKLAAVGRLAAGVAHEVLNPLSSVSSIAQRMRSRCDTDEQVQQLDLMMKELGRAAGVLRDLQCFSHPVPPEHRVRVDIAQVLERTATLISYDRRARGVEITRDCAPELPAVLGDPERLLLVFTNVLVNALDGVNSRADGVGAIKMTARQRDETVVVEFRDNGEGMTDEQIAHAFEPFYTTKGPDAGTGLGLWICHQVLDRQGGAIRIDAEPGVGTNVTIEVPRDGVQSVTRPHQGHLLVAGP